jgi:diaminohydroxyphosphoribosylaminopyrimidine deaminase/5-amino-6-(5-phosphoribosylamino)uracil reductase
MSDDHLYMARALQLAARGLYSTDPNPRVGCVLVKDGQVVGEGWHARAGEPHAEVHALRAAGAAAAGATAYVSLEPCSHQGRTPPCCDALIAAGVARVVAALEDPNPKVAGEGLERLRAAGIATEAGLLAAEAEALNPGFCKRMRTGLPWVRVKLAMSLDGSTAMASGESQWITGEHARRDVQRLRARSSAIVTGSGTLLADDPALNVRLEAEELSGVAPVRQPLRVVLDRKLRTSPEAKLLQQEGPVLILTASEDGAATRALQAVGADVALCAESEEGLDLEAVLRELAARECNEVLVESGPTLAGAFVQAGLVDELIVYLAPHLMGADARGLLRLPGLVRMEQRIELEIRDIRAVGRDWRINARPRARPL